MANIEEAIRRLQFLYETHGAEEVAAAQRAITASTSTAEKASLSLEKSFNSLERRYISTVRAQQEYDRAVRVANDAVKQNPALQDRANAVINAAQTQYIRAAQGAGTYGQAVLQTADSSRLARHEMINLSRQIQDVGVSLASGQAPFTVLIQQGAQIADVFATSSGTIMGFFRQAGAAAAGFAASTAGIVTGVLAVGAAVAYSAASYASAQREIGKALSGIGAASGVTKDQINAIGEASSSAFGISTSEAREAATAFASTGDIYAANVAQATRLVNDYAKAGTDSATASKKLAEALVDPAAGALELNKGLGFLNATTLNYIRSLQAQGREQEAQAALMDAMTPKVQEQSKFTGFLAMAWNAVANAVSNANTAVGKSTTTGGGGTAATLAATPAAGPSQDAMRAQQAQIEQMKLAYQGLATEGTAALDKLSLQADAASRAFLPMQAEIEKTRLLLSKLQQMREVTGGGETGAETVGKVRLQQLQEQNDALLRQAQYIESIAAKYPGMTIETAKQLEIQNAELAVAKARTQAEQDVAEQYLEQTRSLMQGKGLEEILLQQAGKRAIAEAQARKAGGRYYSQNASDATNAANAANGAADATDNYTASTSRATGATKDYGGAAEQAAQADSDRRAAADAATEAMQRATGIGSDGMKHLGWQVAKVTTQTYQLVDAFAALIRTPWNASISDLVDSRLDMLPGQFGDQGAGYTSTYDPMWKTFNKYLADSGMQSTTVTPGSSADDAAFVGRMDVSSPAAIQSALRQVFDVFTEPDSILGAANRLIEAASPDQQASLIQQTINQIRSTQQPSLATEEAIKTLTDKLEQLTGSTDSLNSTIQGALSPFYSQDPRTTKLGFRAGVEGNPDWMTGATNANPLVAVLGAGATAPGMASGGSFMVGGGYSANDNKMAVFPVASGEEVVVNRNAGSSSGQVINIDNRIIVTGSVSGDTLSRMKVSRYQQSQRMARGLAG